MINSTLRNEVNKEFKRARRDGRLLWGGGLLLVFGLASCFLGWVDYRQNLQQAQHGNETSRKHWVEQEAKNPHSAAHYGVYVFREPGASALFDPGVQPYAGDTVFIEAHYKNDAKGASARSRTSLARFGALNPAFFLIWILPLAIILLGAGAIAGEREAGLFRAIAATGVSPQHWLAGKWLALISAPVIALIGCFGLALILSGGKDADLTLWFIKALGYLLYIGAIVNITLWVSARMKTAGSALLTLLCLWLIGSLAAPRLAANIAENIHPTPLRHQFQITAKSAAKEDLDDVLQQLQQNTLGKYGAETTADLPINYNALSMQTEEEHTDAVNDRFYGDLYKAQQGQLNVYRIFSVLWPLIPARLQSMTLSHSDLVAHQHFNQQTETYRREFVKILNDEMMNRSRTGDWGYQSSPEYWADVPDFSPKPRPTGEVLRQSAPDLFILLGWFLISAILLFGGAGNLFRRGL